MELAGQVAVVTGGSRGIGRAIAQTLAAMQAHVIINYVANQARRGRNAPPASKRLAARRPFAVSMWPMRRGRRRPLMQSLTTVAESIF